MDNTFNNGKIYCTKCGAANKAGYRFCVKCGTKLMTPAARTQAEDVQDIPKVEPVKVEPQPEIHDIQPTFDAFEEAAPAEEPAKAEAEPERHELQPTFSAFNETAPAAEPERHELQPTFDAFEEAAPAAEPAKAEAEPERHELQPMFDAFKQAAPAAEPVKAEAEPEPEMHELQPTFSAFEQAASKEEPVRTEELAGNGQAAFEAEPKRDYTGFARSGFAGTATATAAAGAFATAVDAVKNKKQIDVSDAETVMSLLDQGEPSALAKGLPAWDIVPPQVVVRRKHRV